MVSLTPIHLGLCSIKALIYLRTWKFKIFLPFKNVKTIHSLQAIEKIGFSLQAMVYNPDVDQASHFTQRKLDHGPMVSQCSDLI